jgi:hypothetical protein
MSNWNEIKNNIAELNNMTKQSPKDNKPLDNEFIMCLFCNKINLKYRYKPYYEVPFMEYTTRMFDTLSNENKNFFIEASKDNMINTYINSIKNVLITQIDIFNRSEKINSSINKDFNIDINLLLISAIDNLTIQKYKKLSEFLYDIDIKYLEMAKESIINSNKNKPLDVMIFGIIMPEHFSNINNVNQSYINIFLIIIIILLLIYLFMKKPLD